MELIGHSNVHLYPSVVGPDLKRLEKSADCYLDINYGPKEESVINTFVDSHKPILTFKDTSDDKYLQQGAQEFANDDVDGIVSAIKNIMQNAKE